MNKYKEKMNLFQVHKLNKPMRSPTIDEVKQIENEIGSTLPSDYVNFLIHFGGLFLSTASASFYRSDDVIDTIGVETIYGFLPDNVDDIISNYHTYQSRMPNELIPIACDAGAGEICLSVSGDNKGAVYYWDRYLEEDPEEGEEVGYSNLFLIARTFDEFINSLEVYDDEAEE